MNINEGRNTQVFTGVMDADSESRFVQPGNYRYLLNGWNGINNGSEGAIVDAIGNTLISNPNLPAGTNTVIGYFEDLKDNSIIYAVYNSGGYHGWYRWYAYRPPYANGVIETLWKVENPSDYSDFNPDPLNFKQDSVITGVDLVDNILYWVDGDEPKRMDIVKANMAGKLRRYNIYINQDNLSQETTYTVNIYDTVLAIPTATVSYTTISPVRSERIAGLIDKITSNSIFAPFITVENRGEYIAARLENSVAQYLTVTESTVSNPSGASVVVPDNFYPDKKINNLVTPWGSLDRWAFCAAKSPSECAPRVSYNKNYNIAKENLVLAHLRPYSKDFFSPSSSLYFNIGSDNKSTGGYYDPTGTFTIGLTTDSTSPSSPAPASYWASGFNGSPVRARLKMVVNIEMLFGGTFMGQIYFQGDNGNYFGTPVNIAQTSQYQTTVNIEDILIFPSVNIAPKLVINVVSAIPGDVLRVEMLDGYIAYDSTPLFKRIDYDQPYIFRSKYIYNNYENSVYSAISETPLPINFDENCIAVDYSDKWIATQNYSWAIRQVVLAVSKDNGDTWFDFAFINPYDFLAGEQVYYFTGQESLIAVSSAVAALNYHAVPYKVSSQSFIGERLWYGGITEGYDKLLPKLSLTVDYLNLTDPALYPNNDIYTAAQATKNFGCFWKRGYYGYVGLVYYDSFDRSSPVCINTESEVKVRFFNEVSDTGTADLNSAAVVRWEIYHEPPSFATHYRFARTNNLQHGEYLECAGVCTQVDDSFNPVTFGTGTYTEIDVSALATYNDQGYKLDFTYAEGDFVRFIQYTGSVNPPYHEFRLEKVISDKVYIKVDPSIVYSVPNGTNYMEFFTPVSGNSNIKVYKEFGECYEIGVGTFNGITKRYHKGQLQDQSYGTAPDNTITPATGVMGYGQGNAFYRLVLANNAQRPFISDRNNTKAVDNGRVNSSDLIGMQSRPTALRFSDQYISSTQINGLNAFQPANEKQYDSIRGLINKLLVQNNDILKVFFANGWQLSVYVGQSRLQQSQSNPALIVDSETVAGNSHLVQRTLSTINPESVALNDEADAYGFDQREGVVWVNKGDGLYQISDILQKTTFKNIGQARMKLDLKKSKCAAIYDLYRDVYIISFNPLDNYQQELPFAIIELPSLNASYSYMGVSVYVNNTLVASVIPVGYNLSLIVRNMLNASSSGITAVLLPDGTTKITAPTISGYAETAISVTVQYFDGAPKTKSFVGSFSKGVEQGTAAVFAGATIEFSKVKNGWTTYYSFVPELFGRLRNNIVSFKDGEMWLHGVGTAKNFYGTQYNRKLRYVCNDKFPKVKAFKSMWVTGQGLNSADITVMPYQGIPTGMHSQLGTNNFSVQQGIQMASFLKDDTTPGFPNADSARLNGRPLVGQVMEIEISNNDNTQSVIYSCDIVYNYSEKS